MKKKLVLATQNSGKVTELSELVTSFEVLPRPTGCPEVEETGDTFLENALLKASFVSRFCRELTLADDSGLIVDALDGAPGVRSARFAGEDASDSENLKKLLEELKEASLRSARFHCCIVLCRGDGEWKSFEGEVEGTISHEVAGVNGFGYDPVFLPIGCNNLSFAQLPRATKNSISHRGKALERLRIFLTSQEGESFIGASHTPNTPH